MSRGFRERIFEGVNLIVYLTVLAGLITAGWALLGLLIGVAIKAAKLVLEV